MTNLRSCLNLFFACTIASNALAMEPLLPDPIEIDEPVIESRIPTLEQLCIQRVVRDLSQCAQNPKIHELTQDHNHEIIQQWMFGENDNDLHRNPAIIWLMGQCPIRKCESCQFERSLLAVPVTEFNNMRLSIENYEDGFVARVKNLNNEVLYQFTSDMPFAYAQFSPDGRHLFLASKEQVIAIIATEDWSILQNCEMQGDSISNFISLHPKSWAILCASTRLAKLYDSITGDFLCDITRCSFNPISEIGFSLDGEKVYVLYENLNEMEGENFGGIMNVDRPQIMADVYDISAANNVLRILPSLTLKQSAAIESLHKLAIRAEAGEQAPNTEIKELCATLPKEIEAILAASFAQQKPSTGISKRRKIESCAFLG